MILRAVEGAVLNTAHAHPDYGLTHQTARSIAKRAAGTLTAGWPDVLAAVATPSDSAGGNQTFSTGRDAPQRRKTHRRGPSYLGPRRSPLHKLHKRLGYETGKAKRDGDFAKAKVLIEVLRMLAETQSKA